MHTLVAGEITVTLALHFISGDLLVTAGDWGRRKSERRNESRWCQHTGKGPGRDCTWGQQGFMRVIKMFWNEIKATVGQLCEYTKSRWPAPFPEEFYSV